MPWPIASAFSRSSLLMLQLLDGAGQHRRIRTLDVDLIPARDDRVGLQPEQVTDDREPLEHRAGSKVIFGDLVAAVLLLSPDFLDAADHAAGALAHSPADQILDANHAAARRA